MKKLYKALSINIIFLLISSCTNDVPVINKQSEVSDIKVANTHSINTEIKGKVEMGDFRTKADNTTQIVSGATVSVIYPSDFPTVSLRNNTIATGLTDINGNFTISGASFSPQTNQVFILEVSKRVGGIGSDAVSLRTHIRWNGNGWDSITKPSIIINKKSTAMAIISGLDPAKISSNDTIGRITVQNNQTTVFYDSKLTMNDFERSLNTVSQLIYELRDPVSDLYDYGNSYISSRSKESYVKSNMHTLQTMIETYAVDWGGIYPKNVTELINESKSKNYYRNNKNPFYLDSQFANIIDPIIDYDVYVNTKQTLNYKNTQLDDIGDLRGVIIYKPDGQNYPVNYAIYGLGVNGDFMKNYGSYASGDYYLTNN